MKKLLFLIPVLLLLAVLIAPDAPGQSSFYSTSTIRNDCTDTPLPGAFAPTWTAGHTYCLGAGTYTVAASQTVNVNNVTVLCTNPAAIIQRTGTTDLFDLSGNFDRVTGCTLDGNSQSASGTGPLVNITGNDDSADHNVVTNAGTTNPVASTLEITNGARNKIDYNTFPSTTDSCVAISPAASATVTDPEMIGNRIASWTAGATTLPCVYETQPVGTTVLHAKIAENLAYGSGAAANNELYGVTQQVSPLDTSVGLIFSHNSGIATGSLFRIFHLFGVFYGTIDSNVANGVAQTISGSLLDLGDVYDTTIHGNSIDSRSSLAGGIACLDCTRNTFTGNTIDGVSSSKIGILIESVSNPSTDNTITGNVVRLAGASSCYALIANFSSGPVSDNVFTGNHCIGTAAASEAGLTITDASGGAVGNLVAANQFANLSTGITIGAGVTNTQIDVEQFDTVTTHISDSGTGTAIQTLRFSSTGALASGTATVTFPNGGFSSATSYVCTARDTTTPGNTLTQGTFAAGSVVLTGTGTDGYAISCGGQ